MEQERVRELEQTITTMRVDNAKLATSVEHLTASVRSLNETVQSLRDAMNRGRGALWLAAAGIGASGGVVALLLKRIFGWA